MSVIESGVTRRQVLAAGTAFAGYTLAVETVLAQAIKTDASGLAAGDFTISVERFNVPVYEARPATGQNNPIRRRRVEALHRLVRQGPEGLTRAAR